MTELRPRHWALALAAAMGLHLLALVIMQGLPGQSAALRGGGATDRGGQARQESGGIIVALGQAKREAAAPQDSEEAVEAVPEPTPPLIQEATAVPATPQPAAEAPPEPAPADTAALEATPVPPAPAEAANRPSPRQAEPVEPPQPAPLQPPVPQPPLPQRKPDLPKFEPQIQALEKRLSAVPPPPAPPRAVSPADRDPTAPPDPLAFVAGEAGEAGANRLGNASANEFGSVRELNYQERVLLWLKRHGGYPAAAYRFFQEGVATVRFTVGRDGRILSYDIIESSGFVLLDQATHAMMERSNPVPPIPAEVGKNELTFTVPVRYSRS